MDPGDVRILGCVFPWTMPRDEPPPLTIPLATETRQNTRFVLPLFVQGGDQITNYVGVVLVASRTIVVIAQHADLADVFTTARSISIGTPGGVWTANNQFARDYMAPWLGEG